MKPVLYSFRRCPYAMRARLALLVSGQQVELREIVLRDKAPELLAASPKGTVPVLVDGDTVIDESFDIMLWALERNDPEGWLERMDMELIAECEGPFKSALDRYKYSNRFEGTDALEQRELATGFLLKLENRLQSHPCLSGQIRGITDMAIVTFVRQFANVDREWFNGQPYPNLVKWLDNFLESAIFAAIMQKYPRWTNGDPPTLFPEEP